MPLLIEHQSSATALGHQQYLDVGPFEADLGHQTQAVHFRWEINPDAPVEIQWRFKTDIGSLEEIGLSRA
jgi:hypothetical protein